MSGNDDGMRAVIAAIQQNPLSAGTLFAVVVGGGIMFAKVATDQASASTHIEQLSKRIENSETRGVVMRESISAVREKIGAIDANIQWLVRQGGGSPAAPPRESRDRAAGPN